MPPMRKVELDKAAWAWCNDVEPDKITDEHIAAAYRLNAPKCGFSTCRRNCLGNPFCLNGLGESKWMSDLVEELDDDDLDIECRKPNGFVGLKNLGATCYINSLLQLWFHNIAFRNAILRWNPHEDPVDNSVISHLQFLFTLMQFGKRKSVDPADFVCSLEIDVSTQQDAREFSQLFTSYLEDYLKRQSDPAVSNLVNNNFQGHYNYVTRCTNCYTESVRDSTFYELEVNIKGHRTLDESIAEFLQEEKLEGADKYYCDKCRSKQDASRHIELCDLPPVFNIQLIRFLYDRQKGMKKKLNTPLQFPEKLDMSPYLNKYTENPSPVMYNLFAVLIHKGPSANSGHYVAHICDQTSGNWYMFNDENAQKIEGKKLKLNSDEDYEVDESGKKQRAVKAIKGYLSSSNAYMLVYTACDSNMDKTPIKEEDLQQHLKIKLEKYNETFDSMIFQSWEEKRSQLEDENIMKAEMASVLPTLPVTDNSEWEAISIKWLCNWISANKSAGFYSVNNTFFACPHNKINPQAVKEFKFINKTAASDIFNKYGGGPRLDKEGLCKDCVKLCCENIRIKSKITNDQKEISNILRAKENIETSGFWVGKESLRTWKSKAIKLIDRFRHVSNEDNKESESLQDDTGASTSPMDGRTSPLSNAESMNVYDLQDFNEDYPIYPSSSSLSFKSKRKRFNRLCHYTQALSRFFQNFPNDDADTLIKDEKLNESILSICRSFTYFLTEFKLTYPSTNINIDGIIKAMSSDNIFLNINTDGNLCDGDNRSLSPQSHKDKINSKRKSDEEEVNGVDKGGADTDSSEIKSVPPMKRLKIDDDKEKEGSEDGKMNGNKTEDDEDEEYEFNFNEDIVCSHDNLCAGESSRRLVSEQAWSILRNYFPDCRVFPANTEPCLDCQCLASEGEVAKNLHKQQAIKEKELFGNLYMGKNRPKEPYRGKFHVISVPEFLEPWRKFLREPTRRDPLTCLRNNSLLCTHNCLKYNPVVPEDFELLALVTDDEWDKISINFKVDEEITVDFKEDGTIVSTPEVCMDCVAARIMQYDNAKVYIRQISKDAQEENYPQPSQTTKSEILSEGPIRRSSRNIKNKGDKVFNISSSQNLISLKLEILKWLGVAPFDQHLFVENGKELVDHQASLSSLSVFPNSIIYLKVDEPGDESPLEDGTTKKPKFEPEHGFKGTGLLRR